MAEQPVGADDKAQSSEPTGAKDTSENITMRLADDTAPEKGDGSEEQNVPSYRLREETDKRRGAEQRALIAEGQIQQMLISNAQNRPPAPTGESPEEDPLVSKFGSLEDGAQEAYDAVSSVSQAEIQANNDAMYRRIMSDVDAKMGSFSAVTTTANSLSAMKTEGLLDNAAELEMGKRMSAKIQQNRAWGLAENQQHLIDTVYMELLRGGNIKPQVVAPGTPSDNGMSPLQPGGGGGSAGVRTQEQADAELRTIQQQNPKTLGPLSIERLRELDPGPTPAMVSPNSQPVQYVHTR